MKCGPVCGRQSNKATGKSRPRDFSVSQQGSREGTVRGGLVRGAHPVAVNLPSWVLAPGHKASAEKKRASWAVRQEKGNLLEGKERVTGP